jgi:hypothetical protein
VRGMDAKVGELPHFHPLTPTLVLFVDNFSTTKLGICCDMPEKHWKTGVKPGWGKVGEMNIIRTLPTPEVGHPVKCSKGWPGKGRAGVHPGKASTGHCEKARPARTSA